MSSPEGHGLLQFGFPKVNPRLISSLFSSRKVLLAFGKSRGFTDWSHVSKQKERITERQSCWLMPLL